MSDYTLVELACEGRNFYIFTLLPLYYNVHNRLRMTQSQQAGGELVPSSQECAILSRMREACLPEEDVVMGQAAGDKAAPAVHDRR